MEYFIRSGGQGTDDDLAQIVLKLVCNFDYKKRGKNTTASQSGSKKPPAITPHFSGFRMLATGTEARLSNNITLTKISGKGHTMIDYFVMQNRKTFSFDYQRKVVEWNYFADPRLFLNLTGGYFNQVQVTSSHVASVKVADSEKLLEAMKRSAKYMPGELYEQVKALLTPEAIAGMAAFGAAYVASQLTPVGWIADALVAVMFIGGVIFMGTELIEVGKLLIKFYETATNASSDAQYDEAGKYFAEAVTKVGVDVIVLIVFHKATKAVDRKIIKIKSNSGGGGGSGGGTSETLPPKKPTTPKPVVGKRFRYKGYGGDIVTKPNKTTTVIGKFKDPDGHGTQDILALPEGEFSRGKPNNGGINILDLPSAEYEGLIAKYGEEAGKEMFWKKHNQPFLEDAFKRGDDIRLLSKDAPETRTGFYARELQEIQGGKNSAGKKVPGLAEKYGYKYNPSTTSYEKVGSPPKPKGK
jgi:hypothetical protein